MPLSPLSEDDLLAVAQTLEQLGIADLASQRMGELNGGQRQLAYLAQALVSQPKCLLLDEPISALDICHQLEVLDLVQRMTKERGLITLVVLHDLNAAARYCDEVALMHQGRLLLCKSPAVALTAEHVSRVFEVEVEALKCSDGVGVLVASHRKVNSRGLLNVSAREYQIAPLMHRDALQQLHCLITQWNSMRTTGLHSFSGYAPCRAV